MSDEKPIGSNSGSTEDLTKIKKPGDTQLNEEELSKVTGGLKTPDPLPIPYPATGFKRDEDA
jgi:bacteriocin-like protein